MTALSPLLVAALALGAGCGGEPSCPAGSRAEGGRCVPVDAGGADSGTEDGGEADSGEVDGGEPDAGPCGGACGGATPVCDASSGSCVECTGDEHCPGERCDTDAGECVACVEDGDCTDPTAARCDPATHACVGCGESADCGHLSGLGVCDGGECVECTDAERSACGAEACKADRTCSDYGAEQEPCQPCDTDANCEGTHDYCVPMTYASADRGGYCLTDRDDAGGCERPFSITLDGRSTLSGRTGGRYCGINEELASCEAVRALLDDWRCTGTDGRCSPAVGEPEVDVPGALCRTVGGLANRCTYGCGGAVECDESPRPGSTCGDGSTGGDDYCGG